MGNGRIEELTAADEIWSNPAGGGGGGHRSGGVPGARGGAADDGEHRARPGCGRGRQDLEKSDGGYGGSGGGARAWERNELKCPSRQRAEGI
jgi:hypothetical protein